MDRKVCVGSITTCPQFVCSKCQHITHHSVTLRTRTGEVLSLGIGLRLGVKIQKKV